MSLEENIAAAYHEWYADNVCRAITYRGIAIIKNVSDLWNYQEIIQDMKPNLIVEFGTGYGGSAFWFADLLEKVSPNGLVLTVDLLDTLPEIIRRHHLVKSLIADSASIEVRDYIIALRTTYLGPLFIILDSDHHKKHVLAEMESLKVVLRAGDYLVVEDGNINGHPVLPDWGDGPYEAIEEYMTKYPDDYERDIYRENKFGFTFAVKGYLRRKA